MYTVNLTDIVFLVSMVSIHPPPAFGSSPNLEALALEANQFDDKDGDNSVHANSKFLK